MLSLSNRPHSNISPPKSHSIFSLPVTLVSFQLTGEPTPAV